VLLTTTSAIVPALDAKTPLTSMLGIGGRAVSAESAAGGAGIEAAAAGTGVPRAADRAADCVIAFSSMARWARL